MHDGWAANLPLLTTGACFRGAVEWVQTESEGTIMTETSRRYDEVTEHVVMLAQEEARAFNHPYIGTEHLVLGMLIEERGAAARALESCGVGLDAFRAQVEGAVGRGSVPVEGDITPTPRTATVISRATEEAAQRGDPTLDTGHLLLALIHDGGGIASRLFRQLGADGDGIVHRVESELDSGTTTSRPHST